MAASPVQIASTIEQDSISRHRPELAAAIAAAEQAQPRDTFKVTKEQPVHFQPELIDTSINDSGKRKLAYLHYLLGACVQSYQDKLEEHHVTFIEKLQNLLQVIIKSPLSAEDFIKEQFYTEDGVWLNISTLDHVYLLRFCLQEVKKLQPTDFSSLATGLKAISSFFASKEKQTSITQDLFNHIEPASLQLESLIWPYDLYVDTRATDDLAGQFLAWMNTEKPTTFAAVQASRPYQAMLTHAKQLSVLSIKQPACLLQKEIIMSLLKREEYNDLNEVAQLISPKVDVIFVTLSVFRRHIQEHPDAEEWVAGCFTHLIKDMFAELTLTSAAGKLSDDLLTQLTSALQEAQSSLKTITDKINTDAPVFLKSSVDSMLAEINEDDSNKKTIPLVQGFIGSLIRLNFQLAVAEQTPESQIAMHVIHSLIQSAKAIFNAATLVDVKPILCDELGKHQRHASNGGKDALPTAALEALQSAIEGLSTVTHSGLSPR